MDNHGIEWNPDLLVTSLFGLTFTRPYFTSIFYFQKTLQSDACLACPVHACLISYV